MTLGLILSITFTIIKSVAPISAIGQWDWVILWLPMIIETSLEVIIITIALTMWFRKE